MRQEKYDKYSMHLNDLEAQNIQFEPSIFSCYGRRHPRATSMLKQAAARVARLQGHASDQRLLKVWFRGIAAEIWRRAAWMLVACYPQLPAADEMEIDDG